MKKLLFLSLFLLLAEGVFAMGNRPPQNYMDINLTEGHDTVRIRFGTDSNPGLIVFEVFENYLTFRNGHPIRLLSDPNDPNQELKIPFSLCQSGLRIRVGGLGGDDRISASSIGFGIVFPNGSRQDHRRERDVTKGCVLELYGDDGEDVLVGSSTKDILYGGSGNDRLIGNFGDDEIHGQEGDDILMGEGDIYSCYHDILTPPQYSFDDVLYGGPGNDQMAGDCGDDWIEAGLGNDVLIGGPESDMLFGQEGNDILIDERVSVDTQKLKPPDRLFGGDGNDTLCNLAHYPRFFVRRHLPFLYGDLGNDTSLAAFSYNPNVKQIEERCGWNAQSGSCLEVQKKCTRTYRIQTMY